MFVYIGHESGFGNIQIARASGFRHVSDSQWKASTGKPPWEDDTRWIVTEAISQVADRISEQIGEARGGDAYGYPPNEWDNRDGVHWWLIDITVLDERGDAPIAFVDIRPTSRDLDSLESVESFTIRRATDAEVIKHCQRREWAKTEVYS